jgi:MFS family permease
MRRVDPAWLVVIAGISAALHIGKLPPALPVLQQALGISLVEAGFLLSLVQLAGMALGLVAGLMADALGSRRTMVTGLLVLSAASAVGGFVTHPAALLVLRACEGVGFLLASVPAPGLLRKLVIDARLKTMLGWWGTYMPLGTAAALLTGPAVIAAGGWRVWWWLLGLMSLVMGLWLWFALPADSDRGGQGATGAGNASRVRETLSARGPWLAALIFATYSGQWLAVVGFLPSIYAQAGLAPVWAAVATALAAGVNMVGNVASGRLLQRRTPPQALLHAGLLAMALGAVLAFAPWWNTLPPNYAAALRYAGVLLFSTLGGMVPGTLFSLALHLAPSERTLSTTVGWMQQWSSAGQFFGPPLVAWFASASGGWDWIWLATGGSALAGMALVTLLSALLHQPSTAQARKMEPSHAPPAS